MRSLFFGALFNYFAMVHNFYCAADVTNLFKVYTRPLCTLSSFTLRETGTLVEAHITAHS